MTSLARSPLRRLLPLLPLLALSACSGLSVLNAVTPERGYEPASNVVYAAAPARRLDIYTPAGIGVEGGAPVVVFLHSGGWRDGSKSDYTFVGEALASRGWVAVLPDVRQYPQARFPVFVDDAATAVAWTRDNITRYGGDPRRIFVMGHSNGAQIAALLALDPRYLQAAGMRPQELAGWVGLAGPYDFDPAGDATLADIFGPEDRYPLARAVNFASRQAPPTLLVHAEDDAKVRVGHSRNLAAALQRSGATVETLYYPQLRCAPGFDSHACTIMALGRPLRGRSDLLAQLVAFVEGQGRPAATQSAPAAMPARSGAAVVERPEPAAPTPVRP